jgi:hypothetical protein
MGAVPNWASALARAAARLVCFCLAAWWAHSAARSGPFDPLPIILLAGFLGVQMLDAVLVVAKLLATATSRLAWLTATSVWWLKKAHLGLSAQFVVMLGACAIIWLTVFNTLGPSKNGELEAVHIAVIAGFTATLGWVFSSFVTARNTQRQNTITLLLNMRHSDVYSRHFNNTYFVAQRRDLIADRPGMIERDKQALWGTPPSTSDPCAAPQAAGAIRSSYQSVVYVLNYYEFIAAGVRKGALDADIVYNTVAPHLRVYFETFRTWVDAERSENNSKRIYLNLEWYAKKFPPRPAVKEPPRRSATQTRWPFAPKAQPAG